MSVLGDSDWRDAFQYLRTIGISVSEQVERRLRVDLGLYLSLLLKKNESLNLTAIRDPRAGLWKHIVDSLLLCHRTPSGIVLDWGSGGGLPGVPLALYRRAIGDTSPVLFLDSVGKKLKAIQEFCDQLAIPSSFFHERGENFLKRMDRPKVDSIVMRAVAPAERVIPWLDSSIAQWVFFLGPTQRLDWERFEKGLERDFRCHFSREFLLPADFGRRSFLYLDSKRST